MSTTYTCHRQLLKPTGIEHCIRASFTSADAVNLIVAKITVLEVYVVPPQWVSAASLLAVPFTPFAGPFRMQSSPRSWSARLPSTCSAASSRCGTAAPVLLSQQCERCFVCRAIRLPGHARDALLVTFLDAKLSLLEFDPAKNDIVTTAIHCFDDRRWTVRFLCGRPACLPDVVRLLLQKAPKFNTVARPEIRVDPLNRCAAMIIYGTQLLGETPSLQPQLYSFCSLRPLQCFPLGARMKARPRSISLSTKGARVPHRPLSHALFG